MMIPVEENQLFLVNHNEEGVKKFAGEEYTYMRKQWIVVLFV
jgi:hypothetical protein